MKSRANYVLVMASTIVAILLAEILLRVFIPEIGWAQRKEEIIGWSSDQYKQFEVSHSANPKKKRILFLGDSFLAGSGVSRLDQRFPVVMESLFNGRVSTGILAAGGWGTDQEFLAYKHKGQYWEPDLVILAFCANNDISNILSYNHGPKNLKSYFNLNEAGELNLHDGRGAPIDYKTVFTTIDRRGGILPARSYLVDYIRYFLSSKNPVDVNAQDNSGNAVDARYKKFRFWEERPGEIYRKNKMLSWSPQYGVNHVSAYIHEDFKINTYQWRLFERIIEEFKNDVEISGGKLVIMLLPVIFNPRDSHTIAGGDFSMRFNTPEGEFTFRSDEPRRRLREISERTGVEFFDPTPGFIKYVVDNNLMKKTWPNPGNRHFSAQGHEILANQLKDFLEVTLTEIAEGEER